MRRTQHILRLLAFDLLVCDSDNLMHRSLASRYGVRSLSSALRRRTELMAETTAAQDVGRAALRRAAQTTTAPPREPAIRVRPAPSF